MITLNPEQVKAFVLAFEKASASKKFDQVAPLIHPEALFRFNEGDFQGLEAIKEAFERTWAHEIEEEEYKLSDIKVRHLNSQSATVTFTYHWRGKATSGPLEVSGRGTQVIGLHNGRLQVMLEHLSR